MCNLVIEGNRGVVDLSKCPFEFGSAEFLNYHLKDLSTIDQKITSIRYEEELVIELDEEKTKILLEYGKIIREIENLLLRKDIYGLEQDPNYNNRKDILRRFYDYVFRSPVIAARILEEYKEKPPERGIYVQGYKTFFAWRNGILKAFKATKMYALVKKYGNLRDAFLHLVHLKSSEFTESISIDLPVNAKLVEGKKGSYKLPFGIEVYIYYLEEEDTYFYVQKNPIIESLPENLKEMMRNKIAIEKKENFENKDYEILMDVKTKEYKQAFMDEAILRNISITPKQALSMGREAAAWVVGLGAPLENISLDKNNITDIYIDSENSPIYLEHIEFGIVHTLFRYNRDMLERAFKNIVLSQKGVRKFDKNNPVVDVVLKRLSMRCHLQRPPATFGELQGALRIMKESPFTYPKYLSYRSMSPFFTGYDDLLVTLGSSEAVLGLKGVGKTAFTAAKITAIGTRRRIIPIQDIEEIPVRAFRKRGFHIGAARVQSSDKEVSTTNELDLITMANALLRMGDAALIINEIRSRVAVQGVINLLNTQPGVFLLYNLHAESLEDIKDRLELVFGIPSASMFATDRYTFLKKVSFGRKGKLHRLLGYEYESDPKNRTFKKIFSFVRGNSIENSYWKPEFINNKEALAMDLDPDFRALEKGLDIAFEPPVLVKRSEEKGISVEQFILQAFYKGMVYNDIYNYYKETENELLLELDYVLKANIMANKILKDLEDENGNVDFKRAKQIWREEHKKLFKKEIKNLSNK